ncbi:GNAT family N-acetyltransferase [Vibrio anguillarum]|uniref:GNAT family N-acetyltransferase n=1 Tax=Vibrio anguillarum TaxID=55601 RepID=UPI001C058B2F|nr:GNAT family N-acetyltransferase [Vibrio anguillarum]MBU0061820.1 GNAT family N-acetyltransferase [Vibrio anguillarum]
MSDFQNTSEKIIENYKNSPEIKVRTGRLGVNLTPITYNDLSKSENIRLLSEWRKASEHAFLKVFEVTDTGTAKWLESGVLHNPLRLMFWVEDSKGRKLGHIGVSSFDSEELSCEVDNVIKSPLCNDKGIFTDVLECLINLVKLEFSPKKIKLRVFSENIKAISLYDRLGFKPIDIVTFTKVVGKDYIEWIESKSDIDRCFLIMEGFVA